ncbi:MAG: N(5)-(carboxyethyl)ornithine synthase [Candidatus Kapaibacteriales bacterium]
MNLLTVGVFGTSKKKEERRVPIHPEQIVSIDKDLRDLMYFEKGYGEPFGLSDEDLGKMCGGILSREELFQKCDVALLAKPILSDFQQMKEGGISWGWPHCVQQRDITQTAIDRNLTLIAWEAMHSWSDNGEWQGHTFQKNNEIAGYAGVNHAMNLLGVDGNFGPERKATVISYGSVSYGAILALKSRGIDNIEVFSHVDFKSKYERLDGVSYLRFKTNENGNLLSLRSKSHPEPFINELLETDIIVNGLLQDTDNPFMVIPKEDNDRLKANSLIIDISCDEGMGFSFAKPTDFENPTFRYGKVNYYAVDHTPSYLWNAASWEISKALLPYLEAIMKGPEAWAGNDTIRKAIEIQDGIIQNPKILSFQNRKEGYPHDSAE